MSEETQRAIYTNEQINAYLARISFPVAEYKTITPEACDTEYGLAYLSALQKYHLAAIPFENLSLHYSKERYISLNKNDVFDKIVTAKNGRGGYCMENNLLFATVMRSLGFEVITVGGKVPDTSSGWNHHVNLVCISGGTYLIDVGFGGNGPICPMRLEDGSISSWGATNAETRLIYRKASNPILHGLWQLEHRISKSHDWTSSYCFGMTEFSPEDFEVMNFSIFMSKASWFTYKLICIKMILDEDVGDITGILFLRGGKLKKRLYAKSEVLAECTTEQERVMVLKEHFGISLSEREQAGILSSVTQLGGNK